MEFGSFICDGKFYINTNSKDIVMSVRRELVAKCKKAAAEDNFDEVSYISLEINRFDKHLNEWRSKENDTL